MNAIPTQITMSIGISNRFSVEALNDFYEGVFAACEKYNVDLVGGDTSSSLKGFVISVTAIGEANIEKVVKRNGAQNGNLVCVSGNLGAAFLGLTLLEREKKIYLESPKVQPDLEEETYVVGRLLKPEARKDIIEFFEAEQILPTAMMDVSDGLSSEVNHICKQSNLGCIIYEEKLPILEDSKKTAFKFNIDPSVCALNGGEDYELLFTIQQSDYEKLRLHLDFSIIGHMVAKEEGLHLVDKSGNQVKLEAQGWKAF